MCQYLSFYKKVYGADNLQECYLPHDRDVEHSVVGCRIGCLAVSVSITHAEGHHAMLLPDVVDGVFHLVCHLLEEEHDEG